MGGVSTRQGVSRHHRRAAAAGQAFMKIPRTSGNAVRRRYRWTAAQVRAATSHTKGNSLMKRALWRTALAVVAVVSFGAAARAEDKKATKTIVEIAVGNPDF